MGGQTDYTTNALIKSIKRRAFLPAGAGLTTSDILAYATEELRGSIPAFLKGLREEYLVATLDVPITTSTLALPARAVGAALRIIQWKDNSGLLYPLTRIEPERLPQYNLQAANSQPAGYYFEGNTINLVPSVGVSGTLHLTYQQRPGELVLPTDCAQITAINTGANQVTVSAVPTTITTGTLVDIVSNSPNFIALALDQAVTVSGSTFTFSSLPTGLAVGDWVALAGQTPVVQAPTEVHDLLAQYTAATIAQSMGSARAEMVMEKLTEVKASMTMLLSPRSDGNARKIVHNGTAGTWWL